MDKTNIPQDTEEKNTDNTNATPVRKRITSIKLSKGELKKYDKNFKNVIKTTKITKTPSDTIPQNVNQNIKISEKMENGEKKVQKKVIKKSKFRNMSKSVNSYSDKNLPIFAFHNLPKLNQNINAKEEQNTMQNPNITNNANKTNNIILQKDSGNIKNEKEEDNGYINQKRAMTPKKITQDVKLVPFDNIEKELILEPKILDSIEKQISFSEFEDCQSIFESFFIASLPKEEYSFAEDINNPGVSYCSQNISQCQHDSCVKLPAYKAGLIFKYPREDKNPQNFEISELVTSLCFPFGVKVCFGKYEKKELVLPKKPCDFYFVTTNGYNDQNYVYVYNFYLKVEIVDFKKNYKCDPIKDYLNLLIKNNDKNFQDKFEECQDMINTLYVYIPHTCCLVSKYPYFKEMRKAIYSILRLIDDEELLTKFLKHIIYEIPDINKFKNYDLQLNYFMPYTLHPVVLKSKYYNRGLYIDIKSMKIIYEYFSVSLLLKIFKLMLSSQKLLFVVNDSSEYKILSLVTLALLNLLYPFNWKYTYIPLLSFNMLKFLQSFLPFIMGMDNNMMEYAKKNYIEKQNNITIINLKTNRKSFIDEENTDENANIEIPSELKDMLINDLKTIYKNYSPEYGKEDNILTKLSMFGNSTSQFVNFNKVERDEHIGRQLRRVFLKFFVEIFGDYQEYTSYIDDTAYFNSESFLNNIPKEQHNFYMSIFNSEMFHDFLQRNVVINSSLYKPDRYYNKYCIREKKGRQINNHLTRKDLVKKKKSFLDDDNVIFKNKITTKNSAKIISDNVLTRKRTFNPRATASSNFILSLNSKIQEPNKRPTITNNEFLQDAGMTPTKKNTEFMKKNSFDASESEEELSTKSLNSSFNEETVKICINNKFSNKYIIPPCFIDINNTDYDIEDIEQVILNFYGEENLIKKNEYKKNYIFEKLPIINYETVVNDKNRSLKGRKSHLFDIIKRYLLPRDIINDYYSKPKRQKSYTLSKSMKKDNRLDPKIIQLEDFMKEILSSSGKNASNILYPKGIDISESITSINSERNGEKEQNEPIQEKEKENGGSKDSTINKNLTIQKNKNQDYLSILDFQNIVIRRHFATIMFQKKINAYQSNIISSNSYNILSKMIFNVFLYSGNKSIEDFQVCRALTKSLYLYYKKNSKGKKVYLFHSFNKAKPFDIWVDKSFWLFFYRREMDNHGEKDDNTKFNILIEIASIMNDLHFSANTQVGIIIDFIAKKEIKDKDLQNTLSKTIVKQCNNRVVLAASMDEHNS